MGQKNGPVSIEKKCIIIWQYLSTTIIFPFVIIFLFLESCPEKISRWDTILYVKMYLFQSITFNNTLEKKLYVLKRIEMGHLHDGVQWYHLRYYWNISSNRRKCSLWISKFVCVWVCVCSISRVWLFATSWTAVPRAPLPMRFPMQEY